MPARKILDKPAGAPWGQKESLFSTKGLRKIQEVFHGVVPKKEVVKMWGKEIVVDKRLTEAVSVRGGAKYRYSGKTREHRNDKSPMRRAIKKIAKKVEQWLEKEHGLKQKFNTAIFTRYVSADKGETKSTAKNGLGWHDDLLRANMVPNSAVASFVLGEGRPILFRPKDDHKKVYAINAEHGSAYVMLPGCQQTYQHCVPTGLEERVSVTLRCVE